VTYPSIFKSLRAQLLLLVFISVLPALGIIIYSGLDRQYHEIEEAKSEALIVLQSLANDHERAVESARQFLITLSKLPEVQNRNASACNKIFRELHKENPQYATIVAATANGMVFANALPFTPYSVKHTKYFQDVLRTTGFSAGEYMIGISSGVPILPFAYPVTDPKGRIKAVLAVGIDLDHYDQLFVKTKLPESSVLALSDHKNIRLNRYPNPENHVGKADIPEAVRQMSAQPAEGAFTAIGADGIKRLYAYKRFYLKGSSSPYLFMRVGIPEEEALYPARKTMSTNVALLCAALIAVLVLGWYVGNVIIVQRLNKLVNASQLLRNGHLTARTGLDHSPDELGELTKAFDEMAEALERKESQRQLTEETLKKSEEKYRTLIESTSDLVFMVDRRGMFTFINPVFKKVTSFTPEELLGRPFTVIIAPELRESTIERFKKGIIGEDLPPYESDLISKNGARIPVEFRVSTLHDEDGNPIGRFGIGRDITERKHAEEALRRSEEKYRLVVDHANEAIFIAQNGMMKFVNPKAVRISGYSEQELTSKPFTEFIHPEDREKVIDRQMKRLRGEELPPVYHFRITAKDGTVKWVEVNTIVVPWEGKPATLSFLSDITERKRAEDDLLKTLKQLQEAKDMLVQSEKLAAIGRLSAGVGHEILNPLNIISMRIQLLEMMEEIPEKIRDGFAQMKRQIDRIVKITKDLSQFSRITKREMVRRDINEVVEHILALLDPRLKFEQIALETTFQSDLPEILMEPDRIEQVILNIINNAADALEGQENKAIEVTTGIADRNGMPCARIVISDNGKGIPPGNMNILFEPFFTTKEAGKGTGLGLYICYNIIQEHGGRLWAENNAGGGASFFIELPIGGQESET